MDLAAASCGRIASVKCAGETIMLEAITLIVVIVVLAGVLRDYLSAPSR
jgi:hypothetical protein